MSNKTELSLEDGMRFAHLFLDSWFAGDATIAGSIRRLRPTVHDVDIVFGYSSPRFQEELRTRIERGNEPREVQIVRWGPKLAAITYRGVPFDLYFSTPETFNALLLIRTGSKENNIRLATIAKRRGWKLHASGEGLFCEKGERIAGNSERSIYDALGIPWQEPWEREVQGFKG